MSKPLIHKQRGDGRFNTDLQRDTWVALCGEWVLAEHLSVSDCDITCEWCALVNFANLLDSDPEAFCEPPNR